MTNDEPTTADTIPCASCNADTDRLELFPGDLCLACYARTPEGRRMPTADDVVRMWGGRPTS